MSFEIMFLVSFLAYFGCINCLQCDNVSLCEIAKKIAYIKQFIYTLQFCTIDK